MELAEVRQVQATATRSTQKRIPKVGRAVQLRPRQRRPRTHPTDTSPGADTMSRLSLGLLPRPVVLVHRPSRHVQTVVLLHAHFTYCSQTLIFYLLCMDTAIIIHRLPLRLETERIKLRYF